MPHFEIVIERKVSYRERVKVVVSADSKEDVEGFDFDLLDDGMVDLVWEEVMEGHGGFPPDYKIRQIEKVDDIRRPVYVLQKRENNDT